MFDRYSFQRKEDGTCINPQVKGNRINEKDVNKFADEQPKLLDKSQKKCKEITDKIIELDQKVQQAFKNKK